MPCTPIDDFGPQGEHVQHSTCPHRVNLTGKGLFTMWTACALNTSSVYEWENLSATMRDRWELMARECNDKGPLYRRYVASPP